MLQETWTYQAHAQVHAGIKKAQAARDQDVAAQRAVELAQMQYQAGVITQTEVLDAEYALLQAELDRTRALANLRLAEARLARALGR